MAWPWRTDIWGSLLPYIQRDIEHLARTISKYEHVLMLVPKKDFSRWWENRSKWPENIGFCPFDYDDIFVRDTLPIWLNDFSAILPRFDGWGKKKINTRTIPHTLDAKLASKWCELLAVDAIDLGFVIEGGGVESDGNGHVMLTRSNMLEWRRNGNTTEAAIESIFQQKFDMKITWLPGSVDEYDLTDGHIDAIARYTSSGVVVYDDMDEADASIAPEEYAAIRKNAEAIQRGIPLCRPRGLYAKKLECYSYANFYVTDSAVIMPWFRTNDPAEEKIYETVENAYDRKVVPINLPTLLRASGGGIHCVVREIPKHICDHANAIGEREFNVRIGSVSALK